MRFIGPFKIATTVIIAAGLWKLGEVFELDGVVSRNASGSDENKDSLSGDLQASTRQPITVEPDDYIYSTHLGASPIVLENHKLIFFYVPKVGCTVLKQLFRRMMGYDNWNTMFPHNSRTNGLVYLHRLNNSYANEIMTSPEYTRAIIVRDPKERFLSAYLDKVLHDNSTYVVGACCKTRQDCWAQAQTFSGFFELTNRCLDTHWRPQSERMEPKYLPWLDEVGNMETMEQDVQRLLHRIGAWDDFGSSGWGKEGTESIFQSSSSVHHATSTGSSDSWSRLTHYYTPELEAAVEAKYADDYNVPEFQLSLRKIKFNGATTTTMTSETNKIRRTRQQED